ncbi:MAG: 4-amino-4-deoxy-L-arabinose transferase [Psychromonas sp.]|jgi:4-amino-4-deoxy-L-arabinose transferase|uniref:lipid IV(A) 4-amino-4-deoxy-L-arabinosyltransferase n=1 Tax=Psychromonas sp. TaxID=1884585 RepID=UPI0039E63567
MHKSTINLPLLTVLIFISIYIVPLGLRDLWSPDEIRYAEIAREMLSSGDWTVPTFNGLRYFEKPIMGHWMNAIAQLLFGENNFSARAASAFSTAGSAGCLLLLVTHFINRQTAWISAAIFISLFMVAGVGSYNVLDSLFSLCLTAAFSAFFFAVSANNSSTRCRDYGLAGLFCGLAFLTKGFLALLLPVIVVLPYLLWHKQFLPILRWGWWVVTVALLICLPWALAIHAAEPDYWHYFFWVEHIQRFAAKDAQHSAPFWYYFAYLPLALLPWTFLAPTAIRHLRDHLRLPFIRYLLLWAMLPILFFSIAQGKIVTYILPSMAPIAILLAVGLITAYKKRAKGLKWGSVVNLIITAVAAGGFLVFYYAGYLPLESHEYYRPWLAFTALSCWVLCAILAIRASTFEAKISAYAMMPTALFLLFWAMIPNLSIDSKMPAGFIEELKPLVSEQTILLADHPATMSALNWYLKRNDVYLLDGKGEVKYGLSYPDAADRYIERQNLAQFIKNKQQQTDILILLRNLQLPASELPTITRTFKQGRFRALYFKKRVLED